MPPVRESADPAGDVLVVGLEESHWPQVSEIYAEGIATGQATFETSPPTWQQFDAGRLAEHRFVAVDGLDPARPVLGWVAASAVSDRCAYSGVVDLSVYVAARARGRGVGRALLAALITSARSHGVWTLQAGIFPENEASLALHRSAGFRVVGTRERLGRMAYGPLAGTWRDVVLLERRETGAT